MIAAHDLGTLPRDAALPQLATVLDGDAMASVFAELLQPHEQQVESCTVERVKYRPQRNCTLTYRLRLRDVRDGRRHEQAVAARACGGDAAARAVRASAATLAPSAAGPALRLLPELELLTWWWPNDAKLRAPRALACPQALRGTLLPPVLQALGLDPAAPFEDTLTLVQYVPEHRLTARLDVLGRDHVGQPATRSAYAKTSRDPDAAEVHRIVQALQATDAWRAGRLRTPAALAWQPDVSLHWQSSMPGRPLAEGSTDDVAAAMPALGAQLAALHGTPIVLARRLTREALQLRLDEVVTMLAPVVGDAAAQAAAQAVGRGWHHLDDSPQGTLHGDLHPHNLLLDDDGTLSLIDLDGARHGPRVLELGAWIADDAYRALLAGTSPSRESINGQSMLDAYARAGGAAPRPDALRWAAAWALLSQRAWRCVSNLKPGRLALTPALVALATEWACSTPSGRGQP